MGGGGEESGGVATGLRIIYKPHLVSGQSCVCGERGEGGGE